MRALLVSVLSLRFFAADQKILSGIISAINGDFFHSRTSKERLCGYFNVGVMIQLAMIVFVT